MQSFRTPALQGREHVSPLSFLTATLQPAAAFLAGATGITTDTTAVVGTLFIALQESGLTARVQANQGPAHGFWQFEIEACGDVLMHSVAGPHLRAVCARCGVSPDAAAVWNAIIYNDHLAFAAARLLLLSDPAPLPDAEDAEGWLEYYARNWRPQWFGAQAGAPDRWRANFDAALEAVQASATPTPEPAVPGAIPTPEPAVPGASPTPEPAVPGATPTPEPAVPGATTET